MKNIRDRMLAGELIKVFSVARLLHPTVIEWFGLTGGYDGFWIDQEHGGATYEQINVLATAGRASGFESFVRMAPTGYSAVTQALEAGAGGVMAAQIHSAEEAAQFVKWSRFPPLGSRGLNTGGADGLYARRSAVELIEQASADAFVAIQIETVGALEQVDQIASLDGVDHIFIGPSDLSLAIGHVGEFHSSELWDAIGRVADAAKKAGKPWGILPSDPKFADRAVELGCQLLSIANDPIVFREGIRAIQSAYADSFQK